MTGPTGEDFDVLARSHMAAQVKAAAAAQVLVGRYWDSTIDPHDLDASFERFERAARLVVNGARTTSEARAQDYYAAVRLLAGFEGPVPTIARQAFDEDATTSALYAVGYGSVKRRVAEGVDPATAVAQARDGVLGTAKRRTLASGRQRLIDLGVADPEISGWARVSDGKPCAFCAMLIGRGPVYRAQTVGFRAHDNCGCNVRLVPAKRRDPSHGWGSDALAFAGLAARVGAEALVWRAAYNSALADPNSSVSRAVLAVAEHPVTASAMRASALALAA